MMRFTREAVILTVEGWIGQHRARFLIDTGSPVNIVDREFFESAGEPGDATNIEHIAGTDDAVLGGTFLEGVRICNQPSDGSLASMKIENEDV